MTNRRTMTLGSRAILGLWALMVFVGIARSEEKPAKLAEPVRIADAQLRIAVEPTRGTLRELTCVSDGDNRRMQVYSKKGVFQFFVDTSGIPRGAAIDAEKALPPPVEDKDADEPVVSMAHRALPLINLLAAAAKAESNVMWK